MNEIYKYTKTASDFENEDLEMQRSMVQQFVISNISPMLANDLSDGDLASVPEIINLAVSSGIAASPDPSSAGYEYGIWGNAAIDKGCLPSIVLLNELSKVCGGIAFSLHAQSVASFVWNRFNKTEVVPAQIGLGLMDSAGLLPAHILFSGNHYPKTQQETTAIKSSEGYILNGKKMFIPVLNRTEIFLVIASLENKWHCFAVNSGMKGVSIEETGKRTGLRACRMVNLELNNVVVKNKFDADGAEEIIRTAIYLNWVGLSSIALGIAEGAIQAAEKYAGERIQGGKTIEKHSAVKMLIAEARACVDAASSRVYSFHEIGTVNLFLKKAAIAKYKVIESCVSAVTNSMQVFGGYGYIQDYRIEKRLRDVKTLQCMFGSSRYLKNFIMDIEKI